MLCKNKWFAELHWVATTILCFSHTLSHGAQMGDASLNLVRFVSWFCFPWLNVQSAVVVERKGHKLTFTVLELYVGPLRLCRIRLLKHLNVYCQQMPWFKKRAKVEELHLIIAPNTATALMMHVNERFRTSALNFEDAPWWIWASEYDGVTSARWKSLQSMRHLSGAWHLNFRGAFYMLNISAALCFKAVADR